jgi:hypothetical protein
MITPEDLDEPLRFDDCQACGAIDWADCICSPDRPFRQPTQAELERARQERLVAAERVA